MHQTPSSHRRLTAILATLLILGLIGVVPCITIDGKSYYLQLRSIVYQGDASYYNEMLYHYEGYAPDYHVVDSLPSGYVPNLFPLGFAVLLTPFFLLGHVGGLILNAVGWSPPPIGYSFSEVLFTLMASAALGSLGVLLSGGLAGRQYGVKAAFWATVGIWLASPLPAYIYAQPSFAHSLSVFTSVLVFLIWLHPNDNRVVRRGLALGVAVGLATLTRWQDGVFLILPAWDVLHYARKWKFWRTFQYVILVGIGALVAVLPQLVLWKIQFGNWFTIPQGQGFMRWLDPQIIPMLFGAQHGLMSWTPVIAVAFIAMIWMAIRKPVVGVPLLALLIIQVYVNSVVLDWWAGWGFGGRRFLDMVPFFIFATAFLIKELPRHIRKAVPFAIGALITWNASLLYHYFSGHVPFGGKVFLSNWAIENWRLLIQQPSLAIGGTVAIIGILWISSRRLAVSDNKVSSTSGYWMPSTWIIIAALIYLAGWAANLARTTMGTERLLVLNPEPRFRDWIIITEKPPFEGSGLTDVASPDAPWQQFASWSVKPGGTWDVVTACEGNLSPGDTAAVVIAENMEGNTWQTPLRWELLTGPLDLPSRSWKQSTRRATIARIDLPTDIKGIPYRTFAPLPLYLIRWVQFISQYSRGMIPLNAAYECTFQLPDGFKPNRFEIRLQESERCYIYGIGRLE